MTHQRPVVGTTEPFDVFYRREYRQTLGLAYVLSGNRTVAEELTQEAFEAALRRWHEIAAYDAPGAWVRRVVSNRAVSRIRRSIVETRVLLRLGEPATSDDGLDREAHLDLWSEVRRLPKRQAQAVVLTYLHGLTRNEVADILGCSEETVKTHLGRARARLAERLKEGGESP